MKKLVIGMVIASSLFFLSGCGENPAGIAAGNMLEKQRTAATTQYEAENVTLSGGAKKNTDHANYSGTGFVDGFYNSTTALATFNVNVATAGSYTLTTRYCAGNGTSSNTSLAVNGTVLKNITCNKTTNWDTWANEVETITLRAGNNTIVYKAASSSGACINLDYITVSGGSGTVYTITASASANGTITPSGSVSVNSGANQTFTIRANSGYAIYRVLVDGVTQGSAIATYTFSNVTANHTISATFIQASGYTISTSAGPNGTFSPSGSIVLPSGGFEYVQAIPNNGYHVSSVTVDGVKLAVGTLGWLFGPVNENHTISATFVQLPFNITIEAENATLSGGAKKNTNHANYSGTGFVDGFYNSTTAQASFTVNVPAAGLYTIRTLYSAGNGASTNTSLTVNGTNNGNPVFLASANWDSWMYQFGTIRLNAGNNTIAYKAASSSSACINLDNIKIMSNVSSPTITSQPVSGVFCANTTARASLQATGTSLRYFWYKNGVQITDGPVYSGTETNSIQFPMSATAAGYYQCEIENEISSVYSSVISIKLCN